MELSASYIAVGENNQYTGIWKILFQDTQVLDQCTKYGIRLTIIGWDLEDAIKDYEQPDRAHSAYRHEGNAYLALAAVSEQRRCLSENGWRRFKDSLQPHSYDEGKHEIKFINLKVTLNIHSFIYHALHTAIIVTNPSRLFWEYYKSGLQLTYATCATTYGGGLEYDDKGLVIPGPIRKYPDLRRYKIKLNIAGKLHQLEIRPLWM
jgi:hypothetical protein